MTKVNELELETLVSATRKIQFGNMTVNAWTMGVGCGQDIGISDIAGSVLDHLYKARHNLLGGGGSCLQL